MTLLDAVDLKRHYTVSRGLLSKPTALRAVDGVSIRLERGKTLAVVGESGCGKSTLARMIAMIEPPNSGKLTIAGNRVDGASLHTSQELRSKVQMVFQNPYGSLNPRQKIGMILEEPLAVNTVLTKAQRKEKASAMMAAVGLRSEHYDRYPHMFSGGQRQRIAIARALMLDPELLVLDEPVSALDVSIQAQILNLLVDLQSKLNLGYLFISHDLTVVKHIAHDVMVMYLGKVVEQGPIDEVFNLPLHPYTQALLSATPMADPLVKRSRIVLQGEIPSPLNPPTGCAFHPRCIMRSPNCWTQKPELRNADLHRVSCHNAR